MLKAYAHRTSSDITIYPDQMKAINSLLLDLVEQVPAQFSMIMDVAGQAIACRGEIGETNVVTLGALVAGDLAASKEIARVTGEYQNYQMILREGDRTHAFIYEAGPHIILFVQVPSDVPLGWSRRFIREVAYRVGEILPLSYGDMTDVGLDLDPENVRDEINDAFEDLWSE
jgi:predicted regulator of Ras-like GTPase activity (Roadblock/LC7/MglB family)